MPRVISVFLSVWLSISLGCGGADVTEASLIDQTEQNLLKNGYLWQCGDTDNRWEVQSFERVAPRRYRISLNATYRQNSGPDRREQYDVTIEEVKIFPAYSTSAFSKCIAKRIGPYYDSKKIETGQLRALANLKLTGSHLTDSVTCALEKTGDGTSKWEFYPGQTMSIYHGLLRAFENAYKNETDADFKRSIGR